MRGLGLHRAARSWAQFVRVGWSLAPVAVLLIVGCGHPRATVLGAAATIVARAPTATPTASTSTPTAVPAAPATLAAGVAPPLRLAPAPAPVPAAHTTSTPVPRTPGVRFLVALDPGHGGEEVGAAANGVVERESNLDMAQRVERALHAGGVDVMLTRADGGRAPGIVDGPSFNTTRVDLQARVHAANAAGADVFVSLHSNGSGDFGQRGVEVYYESRREFAAENRRLATLVLGGALQGLSLAGDPTRDRGIIDAACWRSNNGRCVGLFVLSPAGGTTTGPGSATKEATNMPAVLAELLFVSNHLDASLLRDVAVREAMAQGVADGILRYLGIIR